MHVIYSFYCKGRKTMKRKLWNKNFTLLIQGNAVSTIGDVMYGIAIGYWVYQATGSSALMGVMTSMRRVVLRVIMSAEPI